jgi:hypothetical protein
MKKSLLWQLLRYFELLLRHSWSKLHPTFTPVGGGGLRLTRVKMLFSAASQKVLDVLNLVASYGF